jgi:hypothetical protein
VATTPVAEPVAQLPDQCFDRVDPRRLHLDDLRKAAIVPSCTHAAGGGGRSVTLAHRITPRGPG